MNKPRIAYRNSSNTWQLYSVVYNTLETAYKEAIIIERLFKSLNDSYRYF